MPAQPPLPFPRPRDESLSRADFFAGAANAAALAAVEGWRGWPDRRLVLVGPAGAGKSHLLRIWAEAAGAAMIRPDALDEGAVPDLACSGAVALDDAHAVARDAGRERALFHLHNLLGAERGFLLLAAPQPPARWGVLLPDLASRLEAVPQARIDPPDEAMLKAVLVKLFADRQLLVAPPVVGYLARHLPRSFAAARTAVAELDTRALAARREITRGLAIEVLDSLGVAGA